MSYSPSHLSSSSLTNSIVPSNMEEVKENSGKKSECSCSPEKGFSSRFLTDYQVIRCLGRGGFGVVMEARDRLVDIHYAVKRITLPNQQNAREKVMREVKNHARLGHQHIVRYYATWLECPPLGWQVNIIGSQVGAIDLMADDSDTENTTPFATTSSMTLDTKVPKEYLYIAMELCSGGTLRNWLLANQKRPLKMIIKQFRQICSGVAYIHEQRLVHRDLKPENIFLTESGCLKIGDFGLATRLKRPIGGPMRGKHGTPPLSHYVGTKLYMAPEIENSSQEYDYKVDIFSLGIILLELLIPVSPDYELDEVVTKAKVGQYSKPLELKWRQLLERLLSHNPGGRPNAKWILRYSPKTPKPKTIRWVPTN